MSEFVEHAQEIIEHELTARRQDAEFGLIYAEGFEAKEALLEEKAFVDRLDENVGGLLAELDNREEEIELLRRHLADYHQDQCPLVTGDGDVCGCESAPPLLKIGDFEPLIAEAVVVAPAEAPPLRIVSGRL